MNAPTVHLLCGGGGEEHEVSLASGQALAEALSLFYTVEVHEVDPQWRPDAIDAEQSVVFAVTHGTWGEDGQLQALLEEVGIDYAGCSAAASRLCFDKELCKQRVGAAGVPTIPGLNFEVGSEPAWETVSTQLGDSLVLKPQTGGSSRGLSMIAGKADWSLATSDLEARPWLVESRVQGRELTVGILEGEPLGVVEILPEGGTYDYEHKYTAGATRYEFPAKLEDDVTERIQQLAQRAYQECGCRDFARVDFLLHASEGLYFLEINTIPGLTQTSLMPKSASCHGLDFPALCRRMLTPALERFTRRKERTINHGTQ